jgi:hypothetical protein
MKPNSKLIKFIKEARKRGFDDFQIRDPLIKQGWPLDELELAFASLKPKYQHKNRVILYLDSEILKRIEKRADKNMFTITEQIDDILRRSTLNMRKKTPSEEKLDDKFISYFSRKK